MELVGVRQVPGGYSPDRVRSAEIRCGRGRATIWFWLPAYVDGIPVVRAAVVEAFGACR